MCAGAVHCSSGESGMVWKVRSENERMDDVTRGAYMCSRTFLLLRMIGSSSFASYGLIATTVLSFPEPLERIQLTGRRYSVKLMPFESRVVIMKSAVARGEGDHSAIESKALVVSIGAKSEDICLEFSGMFPVLVNS